MARKAKSPTKSPQPGKGELVVPSHGRGKLRRGSKPGTNRGGAGRPPSEIRARLRGSFDARIGILEQIAGDPAVSTADRIRALDLLAKYGLGTQQEHSGPDGAPIPTQIIVTRRVIGAPEEE
jgi:hypothetical protein